ncbi:MAG TPA: hypothetical protein VF765_33540 [Polyangiaceae bacterium]
MGKRHACHQCGDLSPEVGTNYTLIERGWRLTSTGLPKGETRFSWWCPACWKAHRLASGTRIAASRADDAPTQQGPSPRARRHGRRG